LRLYSPRSYPVSRSKALLYFCGVCALLKSGCCPKTAQTQVLSVIAVEVEVKFFSRGTSFLPRHSGLPSVF
jgi:hypothetical protein